MNHLRAESRTVVRLQLEERTVREIAEILGLGIATLKSRLVRARRKLQVLLTSGLELGSGRAITTTGRACDGGRNSHALGERMRSKRSQTAGCKARNAAAVNWPKVARKRTSESTATRRSARFPVALYTHALMVVILVIFSQNVFSTAIRTTLLPLLR